MKGKLRLPTDFDFEHIEGLLKYEQDTWPYPDGSFRNEDDRCIARIFAAAHLAKKMVPHIRELIQEGEGTVKGSAAVDALVFLLDHVEPGGNS